MLGSREFNWNTLINFHSSRHICSIRRENSYKHYYLCIIHTFFYAFFKLTRFDRSNSFGLLCSMAVSGYRQCIFNLCLVHFHLYEHFNFNYGDKVCLFVFFGFLIFSNASFLGLLLVLLRVSIYECYLNYDIRKMIRRGIQTIQEKIHRVEL